MADLSWISALTNQGGGGGSSGGVSDYDQLKNRPVTNIAGTGTVISAFGDRCLQYRRYVETYTR